MLQDRYGNDLTTSSPAARDAYVAACDSLLAATPGMPDLFQKAVDADEGFAMAQIGLARAKQLIGRGPEVKAPLARAKELSAGTTPRERSNIAIFDKILTGQGAAALEMIREHLKTWPRDVMAFAPATSVFGLIGFSGKAGREEDQLALIAPMEKHYGDDWWYRTQLAFAQGELGQFAECRKNIDKALAGNPKSAHTAHIRGHLFYEMGERQEGLAFLKDWSKDYPREGLMHCHNNWHVALWSLETGQLDQAWRHYDMIRPGKSLSPQINILTDCTAFLARAEMAGGERKPELWREIADYATTWFPRAGLGFLDLHTTLAYAMAGEKEKLATYIAEPKGATADMLQPLGRGFAAYADGDWNRAASELEPLLPQHERLGGSRAQRDLLEYAVITSKLKAGKAAEARAQIEKRRPQNAKQIGFPIKGL